MIQSRETFIIASLTQSSKTSDVKSFWPGDGAPKKQTKRARQLVF